MIWSPVYKRARQLYEALLPPSRYYAKDAPYFHGLFPILDVGCGHGFLMQSLRTSSVGLDRNPHAVRVVRSKNLVVVQGSGLSLPFAAHTFGGVYCSHMIEHLNPEEAGMLVLEIDRVLRPNGRVVIKSPLLHPTFFDDPTHVRPYHPSAVIELFGPRIGQSSLPVAAHLHYKFVSVQWDRAHLYYSECPPSACPERFPVRLFTRGASVVLASIGIRRLRKVAYTLVLEKGAASSK